MSKLTIYQKDYIQKYLSSKFYDNSPWLIFMDYVGHMWKLDPTSFGNFYTPSDDSIRFKSDNYYYAEGNQRYFGGWTFNNTDILSNYIDLNITQSDGYKEKPSCTDNDITVNHPSSRCGVNPSSKADSTTYYSEDDLKTFDANKTKRIFPKVISYTNKISKTGPPNAIPGYNRVSRNDNFSVGGYNFKTNGFITLNRGTSNYDTGFILFVKMRNVTDFANDIMTNNPVLINNILNYIYGLKEINRCLDNYNIDDITGTSGDPAFSTILQCDQKLRDNTDNFRVRYMDYVNQAYENCKNETDWCYSSNNNCNRLITNNNYADEKLVNWCIDTNNNKDKDNKKLCQYYTKFNRKLNDLYTYKLCSKDNNSADDIYCKYNNAFKDDYKVYGYDTSLELSYTNGRERRYSITDNWCSATNKFIKGKTADWKWTDNPDDPECLSNWTYYDENGTKIEENIPNITKLGTSVNWCPTRRKKTMDKYLCSDIVYKRKEIDTTIYNTLNTFWKDSGCISNLPENIYFQIYEMKPDEQKAFIEKKILGFNNIYSRNMCLTGDALEATRVLLPGNCIYSKNKTYKACLDTDGTFNIKKTTDGITYNIINTISNIKSTKYPYLVMQADGNLVIYDLDGALWSTGTASSDTRKFVVMQENGKFVLYNKNKTVNKTLN